MNLGKLTDQDFPVPTGFVITTPAYTEQLLRLWPQSNSDGIEIIHRGKDIRHSLIESTLNRTLENEIFEHHDKLQKACNSPLIYAVRSSATAEDLTEASFAGQHESYYYVDENNLVAMVKNCWASLWSPEACSYRASQGVDNAAVKMAVIVQIMVRSDVSGITFTADPVTGDESVVVTEASFGMGAAIVDGRVTPDQYILDRETRMQLKTKISNKRFMVPYGLTNAEDVRITEVPANLQNTKALSEEQIQLVTYYALKAEQYFGSCQDIEWAFQENAFYLLQSRPITRVGETQERVPPGKYVLFKPLVENFTDPLLPLSQDLFGHTFPIVKLIYGRVYLNLSLLSPLIPFKMTDEQLARLSYLDGKDIPELKLSIRKIPLLVILLCGYYLIMGVFYARTRNMPDDFMNGFRRLSHSMGNDDAIDASQAMGRLFFDTRFFEPVGNMVLIANSTAGRYFPLIAAIKFLLNRWLPDLPPEAMSIITSGTRGVLSTDMGKQILQLATVANNCPRVKQLILDAENSEVMEMLYHEPEAAPFLETLAEFLSIHGHRALKEFELDAVRWEENPVTVINMIRNHLVGDQYPQVQYQREKEQQARIRREQLLADIKSGLEHLPFEKLTGFRWRLINFLRNQARYFIKLRENSRFFHIMAFHVVRKKILKLESTLLESGKLKCPEDIFYLRWREIQQLNNGKIGYQDVENVIRERRMQHIRLKKMIPPKTIGINPGLDEVNSESLKDACRLEGQGASPGIFEGIAHVILDPSIDASLKPGGILIAPFTDPAWTPLFLTASAAVVETGSYLSHAGTIAREYGMPCVVDVPECTSLIQSGDRVRVDGNQGIVSWKRAETRDD